MPTMRPGTIVTGTLLVAISAAAHLAAQAAPTLDLGKRDARSKYAFGHLVAVAELPDGRVVASDSREAAFRLLDLAKSTDSLIGQQGDDPEQYASAGAILTAPGDSLYLFDGRGRKFLRLAPDGRLGPPLAYLPPSQGDRRIGLPVAMDANERIYAACFDIDTAARPRHVVPGVCAVTGGGGGGGGGEQVLSLGNHEPAAGSAPGIQIFPFRDAWAVRRDGTMALVLADTYSVVWSRDGHEIGRTGPLPYQPIPLTPAEQRAATDSVHDMMKAMRAPIAMAPASRGGTGTATMSTTDGGGMMFISRDAGDGSSATAAAGTASAPAKAMTIMNPADMPIAPFPANKPPIPSSGTVAIFAPDGMLWVARERAHGDRVPQYDIIGQGRGVVADVRLPPDTRLVGFGKSGVYLAHRDGDTEWLERYPSPRITP
jgi:hypothetical protein